ncbi:hypothetical protein SOVF_072980 isoform A, partial [Spinacia oleracea]
ASPPSSSPISKIYCNSYFEVDFRFPSGPREDDTRIGSAGVVRRQAVDISTLRRVNQTIYLLTTGARESAFRNIKTIAECLADELINAAKGSSNRMHASQQAYLINWHNNTILARYFIVLYAPATTIRCHYWYECVHKLSYHYNFCS